jgi:hypothetical protein
MKSLVFAIALVAASPLAAAAQAVYSPPEGDFSVAFAAPPKVEAHPPNRSKDIGYRRYVEADNAHAFVVSVDEYPEGGAPLSAGAGVYDRLLRGHAEDSGAQLVSTRPARLAGRPCLEGTFKDDNEVVEVIRVLIVGNRLWRLTWVHPDGADQDAAANAFFGSFKLTAAP